MSYRGRHNSGYARPTRRVLSFHAQRSNRAKRIDESLRAPLAKTPEQWLQQPNRFDVPEVDTPKKTVQEEKDAELRRQIEKFEANRVPSSHRQIRERLATHKLYGVTH